MTVTILNTKIVLCMLNLKEQMLQNKINLFVKKKKKTNNIN